MIATADPKVRAANLTPLTEAPRVQGQVAGAGPVLLLKDTGQEGLLEARFALARFKVAIAEHPFSANGTDYPAGSWILAPQAGLAAAVRDIAGRLGLDFVSTATVPDVPRHETPVPRLGLWVPWADTDTIGWARYTLDQRHIPYVYVRDEDIRAGKLKDKYDVLLYGHVDLELAEQIEGLYKSWGPMPFKKTSSTPSFGTPASSDDITGGIGYSGLAQLQQFVNSGGLLITLGNGSMLPLEGGLVRGVRREAGGVPRSTQGGGGRGRGRLAERHHQDARRAPARVLRAPGASDRVRLRAADVRVPPELRAVFHPAALAADGVLHDLPRRAGGPQQHRARVGRPGRRAAGRQRPGLGRGESRRPGGHHGSARRCAATSSRSTSIRCTGI